MQNNSKHSMTNNNNIKTITFPVGMLGCNCSLLIDNKTKEAILVDPGDEHEKILSTIKENDLDIKAIVHTHAHIDHIGATFEVHQKLNESLDQNIPTYLHDEDFFLKDMLHVQAAMLGLHVPPPTPIIDHTIKHEQTLHFGEHELAMLHTPGHTPGSCCFYVPNAEICFSGDTLFKGSVGRTDLPGGDFSTLESSIKNHLYSLNSAVRVITGHGPDTTIDFEKSQNPFVRNT